MQGAGTALEYRRCGMKMILGPLVGAVIGGVIGYFGKCAGSA
jgi:hypothetical protein